MAKRVFPALILIAILALWVPFTPARADAPCAETAGALLEQTYRSAILNADMAYAIYTPPCYAQTTRPYPVVYLLHGSDAEDTGYWVRLGIVEALDGGLQTGVIPPMLVVMPFGGWIANQNQFGAVSWGNVFLNELMPAVESTFRVDARRETRAIGGISRGGFWAFNLAFQHPDLFGSLGGHSPFFHPDHWRGANPLFLAESAPGLETLRIWIDYGRLDYAGPNADLLHRRLDTRGVAHWYTVYPEGRHEGAYWAAHVMDYLMFYGAPWLDAENPITPTPTLPPARPRRSESPPVFLPATGYKSLRVSIPLQTIQDVANGLPDTTLILDTEAAGLLRDQGVRLHPDTRIVDPAALLPALEQDRSLWTLRPFEGLTPRFRLALIDEVNPIYGLPNGDLEGYPLAFGAWEGEALSTLLFSGVTAVVRLTADAADTYGEEWAAAGMRGLTRRADFFHVSNEVSFYATCPRFEDGGRPPGEFCAKDVYLAILRALGTDIVELSGNHNLDFGVPAYLRTLAMYEAAGMRTVGGGANLAGARQPLILDHHGNRIALLTCNGAGPKRALATDDAPGAAFCDEDWLSTTLPALRAENDVVIVTVQYIETDSHVPGPRQRADFRKLADWGADVVLGTQAHLPQTFEFYTTPEGREVYLHYGLGNLYFDQTYFYMRSFLPELVIYRGALKAVGLNVAIIDDLGRPRPMDEHNRGHFLAHMFVR